MSTTSMTKTDFIKFNVSPKLKILAAKKAKAHGMSLSELGRMLFGAFVSGLMPKDEMSPKFRKMAEQARKDHESGKGKTFANIDDMLAYMDSL